MISDLIFVTVLLQPVVWGLVVYGLPTRVSTACAHCFTYLMGLPIYPTVVQPKCMCVSDVVEDTEETEAGTRLCLYSR